MPQNRHRFPAISNQYDALMVVPIIKAKLFAKLTMPACHFCHHGVSPPNQNSPFFTASSDSSFTITQLRYMEKYNG
jgi:hypothetical protein